MWRKGKRKGKEALVEELQKKKLVSKDDTAEFIKALKRSRYSVVEQMKK